MLRFVGNFQVIIVTLSVDVPNNIHFLIRAGDNTKNPIFNKSTQLINRLINRILIDRFCNILLIILVVFVHHVLDRTIR